MLRRHADIGVLVLSSLPLVPSTTLPRMTWWDLLKLVLATALGFAGGRLAVLLDRRAEPDWQVVPTGATEYAIASYQPRANTFIVTNRGGPAYGVVMDVEGGSLVRLKGREDFKKNDDEMVNVPVQGNGYIRIRWQTRRGKPMGPVERFMAPKR
jgi:hypothetical protein